MLPLETTIFDFYDLDFIKKCAVKSLVSSGLEQFDLNFEGIVAGIELSAKTAVV